LEVRDGDSHGFVAIFRQKIEADPLWFLLGARVWVNNAPCEHDKSRLALTNQEKKWAVNPNRWFIRVSFANHLVAWNSSFF
jgi:hypothetical protein